MNQPIPRSGRTWRAQMLPLTLFLTLGLLLVLFVTWDAPAWADPIRAAGTLPIIQGTVHLEGRASPPGSTWVVPLVVTLHDPGDPSAAYTYNVTTNSSGVFSFTHPVSGTYLCDIRVKHAHTLRNVRTNVTLLPDDNTLDFGALREGDANDDNRVSLVDFSILATTYDKGLGQPDYDARADFNTNDWIEIADFSLLATNYDRAGDLPAGSAPLAGAGDPLTFSLLASRTSLLRGEQIELALRLDPHGQPFQGVQAKLSFDPAVLQIVDAAGLPATQIAPGDALPVLLTNTVNNAAGSLTFAAGILEGSSPADAFTVATFHVKSLAPDLSGSDLSFVAEDSLRDTAVTYAGFPLPLDLNDVSLEIAEMRLWLPLSR